MEPRQEIDIIRKVLKLTLGGKEYEVPVLRMNQAAVWRKEYFERTKEVSDAMPMNFTGNSAELSKAIGHGLTAALLNFPDKIPELVFSYTPSLNDKKETILAEAYDAEFSKAFSQIWQVAFEPFLASLGMVLHMQRSTGQKLPSAPPSN